MYNECNMTKKDKASNETVKTEPKISLIRQYLVYVANNKLLPDREDYLMWLWEKDHIKDLETPPPSYEKDVIIIDKKAKSKLLKQIYQGGSQTHLLLMRDKYPEELDNSERITFEIPIEFYDKDQILPEPPQEDK